MESFVTDDSEENETLHPFPAHSLTANRCREVGSLTPAVSGNFTLTRDVFRIPLTDRTVLLSSDAGGRIASKARTSGR